MRISNQKHQRVDASASDSGYQTQTRFWITFGVVWIFGVIYHLVRTSDVRFYWSPHASRFAQAGLGAVELAQLMARRH